MIFSREEKFGDARLILGDALEVLPELTGISHIISDPPYEDELHAAVGKINRIRNDGVEICDDLQFDGINTDRAQVARLCVEASSGWLLLFTLAEGVRAWRDDIQAAGGKWDTTLAWVKPDASPRFNGQGPSRGFECVATAWCGVGYRSWNGGGMRGVFTEMVNPPSRHGGHPTEKPLSLMLKLVKLYTQPGDLVCDPFAGSFTTGLACLKLGRKFIGIEKNEKYFEMGLERMKAVYDQPSLFSPAVSAKQIKMDFNQG